MPQPPEDVGYDDAAAGDDDDDWGFTEDPTAPTTVEGKLAQMGQDLRQLTRAMLVATAFVGLLIFGVEQHLGHGFGTSVGFVVGGVLATVNLWILAGGWFALIDQRAMLPRVLLAATGSLVVLLGAALYILTAHRELVLGFAFGLSMPALGGILYGVQKSRAEG